MSKRDLVILFLIVLLGIVVRFYKFDSPIADWHSWRQADTSSVSRDFLQNNFDVLHPTYHDLSNVPSAFYDNPMGYRFVEFPIYNVLQAGSFFVLKTFTLEQWGRLVSIVASTFSTILLFLIVRRHANTTAALATSFFFSFLPFNIYYGRSILPDSLMVTALLGGIYFFDKWIQINSLNSFKTYLYFLLSILFTGASLLLKPYALFFVLPLLVLSYQKFGIKFFTKWQLWVFAIVTVSPLIWWRIWMMQYPEGIPLSNWLFNGNQIRFNGSFFYWLFADRIGKLILGYWGVGILVIGIIAKISKKSYLFLGSFLASSLLFFVVVATGNVQHDYYQILIVPSICIFLGLGTWFLLRPTDIFYKWSAYGILIVCTLFTLFFGWYNVRDFYNINNPSILAAGKAVDRFTPRDAKIIALYDGDTTFLYQTKRKGWSSFQNSLEVLITKGAQYLVLVNPTQKDLDGFGKQYPIVSQSPDYLLIKLK